MGLASPEYLLFLLLPLGMALFFLLRRRKANRPGIAPLGIPLELIQKELRRSRLWYRLLFGFFLVGVFFLVYAAARPGENHSRIHKQGEGIDIVIILDVSESMDADDFLPSRIEVARSVIRDFIRRRSEDRLGIVIFSGDAVTKSPLTRDRDFLLAQVDDIRLREMKQGTAIGMGLSSGIARLRKSEAKTKVMVLLTDGDSNVGAINPITAANLARQEGIRIYTIGIGKANRVVVPIYAYDLYGKRTQLVAEVPSYLNPELLKEIARITGGKAYMARDPGMLSRFLKEIDSLEKTKVLITKTVEREENYFVPALIGTLLLFLVALLLETRFRRHRAERAFSI